MTGFVPSEAACIAAGNIEFSEDYSQIVMVNHKSGDFRCFFDSTKWVLAILAANQETLNNLNISFKADIKIERISRIVNSMDFLFIREQDLREWVSTSFSEKCMQALQSQPGEIKTVSFLAPVRRIELYTSFENSQNQRETSRPMQLNY